MSDNNNPTRDRLSSICKDAFYSARDNGGTMHTAADDAADAILAEFNIFTDDEIRTEREGRREQGRAEGAAAVSAAVEAAEQDVRRVLMLDHGCIAHAGPGSGACKSCHRRAHLALVELRAAIDSDAARRHDAQVRAQVVSEVLATINAPHSSEYTTAQFKDDLRFFLATITGADHDE